MDKTKLKRIERNVIPVCIRITEKKSKWLKENDYSPTAIFDEACKDLGFKQ